MNNTSVIKELIVLGSKNPLSRNGILIISIAVFLLSLTLLIPVSSLFPSLSTNQKVFILFVPAIVYLISAIILRWVKSFSYTPISIGIAIESTDTSKEVYRETIKRIKRTFYGLGVPKLRVIVYPEDTKFEAPTKAEEFVDKKGLTILIWGTIREGTQNAAQTYTFVIPISHHIESRIPQDRHPLQISMEIGGGIKRNGWVVSADNTDSQSEVVKNNIVEVGLFTLGKCLAHLPSEKYRDSALMILQKTKQYINSWGIIYPERQEALSQITQEICDIYHKRAEKFMSQKDYKPAVVYYEKIRAEGLEDKMILMNLAFCLWKSGDKKGSENLQKKLWDSDPGSPEGRINKAFFAILKRQYKSVIRQYDILKKSGIGLARVLFTVEFLQSEYKTNPTEHGLLFASGYFNYHWGDRDAGVEELKTFLTKVEKLAEYDIFSMSARKLLLTNTL